MKPSLIIFSILFLSACKEERSITTNTKKKEKFFVDQNFNSLWAPQSQWAQTYTRRSMFTEANLENSDFQNCFAFKADFRKANLKNARFIECDLRYADFRGADLRGADFTNALLYDALFEGALINEKTKIAFNEGSKGARFIKE